MAVVTGVMSSATSGKAIYDLLAAQLAGNANWSRPSVSSLTGATNSWGANYTSQIWKCTVGAQVFFAIFSYDTTVNVNDLFVQFAEAYDGSDGGGVPAAAKFRRICAHGGTTAAAADNVSVTPGATDVVTNSDQFINVTSPNWGATNMLGTGSAFNYLLKVGNKSVTIAYSKAGVNSWVHGGAFESLVTGPADVVPLAMFTRGVTIANGGNPANKGATPSSVLHSHGVSSRNPGIGVAAEVGAFSFRLDPLHMPIGFNGGTANMNSTAEIQGPVPRWYTKVLMSQAIINQEANAATTNNLQSFRGYFSDLFAGVTSTTTEPSGGGIDSVVIDGVTYYWLGVNCPGANGTAVMAHQSVFIAVRAD